MVTRKSKRIYGESRAHPPVEPLKGRHLPVDSESALCLPFFHIGVLAFHNGASLGMYISKEGWVEGKPHVLSLSSRAKSKVLSHPPFHLSPTSSAKHPSPHTPCPKQSPQLWGHRTQSVQGHEASAVPPQLSGSRLLLLASSCGSSCAPSPADCPRAEPSLLQPRSY